MTTKLKIILGFSVMLVLLVAMAVSGYVSLQTASSNFVNYRRLANVNVLSSDLKSSIYETVYYAGLYLDDFDPAQLAEARNRVDNALGVVERTLAITQLESTEKAAKSARETLRGIRADLDALQAHVEEVQTVFQKETLPHMLETDNRLMAAGDGARASGNTESLYYQTLAWQKIGFVRENLNTFLATLNERPGQAMLSMLEETRGALVSAGSTLATEQGRRDAAAMLTAFDLAMDNFKRLAETGRDAQASIQAMKAKARDVLEVVTHLDDVSNKLMLAAGSATLAGNDTAQKQMLAISGLGLLLGILFAAFTIVALVRVLGKMSAFAADIAAGNFDSRVEIREKGEIGAMFQAMRRIPEIFSSVIARCNDIANDISSGLLRDRLDTHQFEGGFRELALGVNTIADAYTRSIDSLPVGIVTLDRSRRTIFTNSAGKQMVGTDALKAFGGSMPLLDASLGEDAIQTAESALITPDGARLDVAETALPLRNMAGDTVGGLEVLTDISEIKEKQNLMLRVATEASELADRVAAAAEQLAAQVEQVSRSAEVQRERVETTAGAMTEMNATVSEVARSASEASEQSRQTRQDAQAGSTLVNRVVEAIRAVNAVATRLQTNMRELGEQAESIGSVMDVISDIADQTNLLALNAAIEAARAGEAGRGFAVVADEVRKLAEKTMSATKEVGDNIAAIQRSAQRNIDEVAEAVKSVDEATSLANESGEALRGIVGLADATSEVVSSIATAAEEQSAASEEITTAVEEINRLVSETTEGTIQSSAAVQDLSRTAQSLRRVMEGLR